MDESEASAISCEELLPLNNIRGLEEDASQERLELATTIGLNLLDEIAAAFGKAKAVPEISHLTQSIDAIKGCLRAERVIIGVVGSTGAGKSSVINALLDEESLVPTNCMRACTAVITEIQYNESADEASRYRAEVEFISKNDLVDELEACLGDFRSGDKRDYRNPETEAGVAYSKMQAIFPHLTMNDLLNCHTTAKSLASHESLTDVLGHSKEVAAADSQALLDQVQGYIDSAEKADGEPRKMEYWPLVKVVKIFLRHPILETGLVIVDLPGVQDSNAARSAVASKYIQTCSGLWVVAPITRAVDDKTAHNLLGTTFRRQMQFDGAYGTMSFICSKIDDISITEAMKIIKVDDLRHPAHARHQELQRVDEAIGNLNASLTTANSDHKNLLDQIKECDLSHRRIMEAIVQADKGDEVLLLTPSPVKKRKVRASTQTSRKRYHIAIDSDSDTCDQDSDCDDDGASGDEPDLDQEILTREDACSRAKEMREEKSLLETQKKASNMRKKGLREELKEAKAESKFLKSQVKSTCIQYRNGYSVGHIQYQFAEGVREMDQDIAMREDEENFDPNEDARDYEALADNLPVFCVSSKAYQKMSGRLVKDDKVEGFPHIVDTGIPALQSHALKIIESTRVAACQRFTNELRRYLVSLMMRVVISQQPLQLADDMRQQELDFLEEAAEGLSKKFADSIGDAFDHCRTKARSRIYKKFDGAITVAFNEAAKIAESWRGPGEEKRMRYMTYRATCARHGVFKGSKGYRDLNEELVDPLKKQFAKAWESVCTRRIPEKLTELASELVEHLGTFAASMKKRKALRQSKSYGLVLEKLVTFEKSLQETTPLLNLAMEGQKEANRVFTLAISRAMDQAYALCRAESGTGSYRRMKDHMSGHVETERSRMYAAATEQAKESLDAMLEELQEKVLEQVAHIIAIAREDFTTLVADRNIFKALGDVGKNIERLLVTADARFDTVFDIPDQVLATIENVDEDMPEAMEDMSINDEGAEDFPVNEDALEHQSGMEN